MSFTGAMVSLLRGKQFYYDDDGRPAVTATPAPAPAAISPNGPSSTSANGGSAPVADAAEHTRQPTGG